MTTQIGVLLCDHVDERFRSALGGDYAEVFGRILGSTDPPVATRNYEAITRELPASPQECDAWLITGSRHDAHSDEPWVLDLVGWVRDAVAGGARLAGICFGHQLVARALGGRVERASRWAVGPHRLDMAATPWFEGGTVYLEAMHRDIVVEAPPGAVAIGHGTTASEAAFMVGDNVICVQDHPEFTSEYVEALIGDRRERIGPDVCDAALDALRRCPNDGPTVSSWIVDVLLDRRIG